MTPAMMTDFHDRPSTFDLDQIEHQIQRDLSLRVHRLRLHACEDGLVLEGRTKTYYSN